ncbi:hypothetical protein GCM10023238_26710 [Streptomyces heliomycini]
MFAALDALLEQYLARTRRRTTTSNSKLSPLVFKVGKADRKERRNAVQNAFAESAVRVSAAGRVNKGRSEGGGGGGRGGEGGGWGGGGGGLWGGW